MRKPSIRIATVAAVGALAVGGFGLSQASAENDPNSGQSPLSGTVSTVDDTVDGDVSLDNADLDDLVTDRDTELAAVRELLKEATSAIAAIREQVMDEARTEARDTARAEAQKIAQTEVAKIRAEVKSELAEIRKELAEKTTVVDDTTDEVAAARAKAIADWQKQRAEAIASFREQVKQFLAARAEARDQAKAQAEQARDEAKAAREQAKAQSVNFDRNSDNDRSWKFRGGRDDNRHEGRGWARHDR